MQIDKLNDFTKGWFIGDFVPSLFPTSDFEVAVKYYKAGDYEAAHHHKIATEFTVIIKGKAMMNGVEINEGDIAKIAQNESADFKVLEDTVTVVVKVPCAKDDKYLSL